MIVLYDELNFGYLDYGLMKFYCYSYIDGALCFFFVFSIYFFFDYGYFYDFDFFY